MIIYLLTLYQFDDIEKISESLMRIILLPYITSNAIFTKTHVQPERLYFYLCFALCIIHVDRYDGKTPKPIVLFK